MKIKETSKVKLTLGAPHGLDDLYLDHEDDRGDDDGGQGGLGYVVEIGREKLQRDEHEDAGVDAAEGRPDAGRVIDGAAAQAAAHRDRGDERRDDVAHAQGQHLLRRVDRLALR